MALSQNLVSQFAKMANSDKPKDNGTTLKGEYITKNGVEYVKLDGSDVLTPVKSTVEAENGEKVQVLLKDHTATVIGNISSPAARSKSVADLKNEVDTNGNSIKQLNTTITQQQADITQINTTINQHNSTINQHNTKINQQGDTITSLNNTVTAQGNKITAMNNDIEAQGNDISLMNNTIQQQGDNINSMNNVISAQGNKIDQQANTISQHGNQIIQNSNTIEQQGNTIQQINSNITNIDSTITTQGSNINILNSAFSIKDGKLEGLSAAVIDDLETKNLNSHYAKIDFANINTTAVQKLFTESGIIKNLVVQEGHITGELVGVTIKGDLIEGNTIKADKLVVKGSDGLYYKLNLNGEKIESQQTDQNSLNGSVITAKSITASKITVNDLVAFGATIGGFDIDTHSIHSHTKGTINTDANGLFMDDTGQLYLGDQNNHLKYYLDSTDNKWKLDIRAAEIRMGTSTKTVAEEINEVKEDVDSIPDYIASRGENLVTNGTALLKNNTNFTQFTYDGTDTYYAGGSFKYVGKSKNSNNDEYIPVDIQDTYVLTYYIKCDSNEAHFYDMFYNYDIDKYLITDQNVMYVENTLTTVAQEIKNGDTVIHLTDVSNFKNKNNNYSRKLIFWNYKNSYGYQYEPETYSRNVYGSYGDPLWENESTSIDKTNNTITLRKPWSFGTIPVGTHVSQGNNGATNIYMNSNYTLTPNIWTKKTGIMSGLSINNSKGFRPGTAFIKIGWYLNWSTTADRTTKISTISLTKNVGINTVNNLETYVTQNIENLQHQIDGAIQFWNGPDIPTLNNKPASDWTTESERQNHIADIYTVIQDVQGELKQGKGYRFDKINNNWVWVEITDNELSAVQALASSKAKVFVTQPTVPYNIGDLWLNNNNLYKCKTAKDSAGSYSLSDWELATDYTNDDLANQVQTNLNNLQVGGRNLLLGTSESFNNNDITYSYGYWDIAKSTFEHGIDLEPNEEYILSFDWKIDWNTEEEITKERYYTSVGVGELITTMDQDVVIDQYVTYNSDIKMFNTTSNMSLNYEDIDKTGGSEELHFIPTAAQLANYNKFAMRLARTSVQSSSNTPTITIENLKLEKGTKKTDWSPAPEDIDADIDISNSNIKNLDELLNGINEQGGLISQITDIQQTMAEEFQAVKDRYDAAMAVLENSIVSTIKSIGGNNILHNSVGYNNLEFWNTSTQNKISTYQNDELSLSGSEFILKGGALMWQEVNIQSGMKYNLSCKIKHDTFNTPDTISIKIIQNDPDNTTLELLGVTTQYLDWMSIEVQTHDENNNLISGFIPKPLTNKLKIELSCGGNDNTELFEITDLFLTIGESTIWSGHPDEIYGKEHLLDATGLTLKNLNTNKYARLTSTSLSLLKEYTTIAEISEQRLLSQNGIFLKGYQLGDETKGQPPLKTVRIDENNIIEYVVSLPPNSANDELSPTPIVINYTDISIIEIESEDAGENSVDESFSTESGTEINVISLSYVDMVTFITNIIDDIENGLEVNLGDLLDNIQGLSENLSGQYVTYSLDSGNYISDTDDINDNSVLSSFKVVSKPLAFGYATEEFSYILSDSNNNYLIDYMSIQNDLLIGLEYGDISNLYIMILDPKGSPNYYQIFSIDNLNEIGEFYPYQGIAGLFNISMQGIIVILEDVSNT